MITRIRINVHSHVDMQLIDVAVVSIVILCSASSFFVFSQKWSTFENTFDRK